MKMKRFAAALLAACLLGSCGSDSPEPLVPVKEQNQSLSEPSEDWKEGMRTFSAVTSAKILSNTEQAKNTLYSPASLYLALSATASITGGNTQAELLSLLEADSAENLGTEVSRWRRNIYSDQSENKVLIDGSIWMDDTLTAKQEALETLAEQYHTAAFQMDLNDPATAEQMAQWVREATGGLLGDPETLDPSGNVFSLISALYFYSKWENEFDPEDTEPGSFSAANGTDTDCEYMKTSLEGQYAEQNGVKTAMLPFANGASLVFALPEEGTLPAELAADPDFWRDSVLEAPYRKAYVDWKVPKFQVSGKWNGKLMIPMLQELGVSDLFDLKADFSPLTDGGGIFVYDIIQEATMTIDEKGGEAAAYTVVEVASSAAAESQTLEWVEMHLTRPFLFALMMEGTVLFTGIINNPAAQ